MNQGRVEQMDDARTVYDRPATPFVADFIGQTNLLRCRVEAVRDRRLELRLGDLRLIARGVEPALPAGREVHISVRPEHISVGTEPLALDNSFAASVTRRVYLGALTSFHVSLARDLTLVLATSDQRLAGGLDRGSPVYVGWNAGDERLLDG
jgi:spermidine/putrescine transport system ATP-binding protein